MTVSYYLYIQVWVIDLSGKKIFLSHSCALSHTQFKFFARDDMCPTSSGVLVSSFKLMHIKVHGPYVEGFENCSGTPHKGHP